MSTTPEGTSALRQVRRRLRSTMHRLFKDNIFRSSPVRAGSPTTLTSMDLQADDALWNQESKAPQPPLISKTSSNVFHDQALMQLASAYESLQLGDSREATSTIWSTGVRIFGQDAFERAVSVRVARTPTPRT